MKIRNQLPEPPVMVVEFSAEEWAQLREASKEVKHPAHRSWYNGSVSQSCLFCQIIMGRGDK